MSWQSAPSRAAPLSQLDRLPTIARLLVTAGLALAKWQSRQRARRSLALLDERLLHDIGIGSAARDIEAAKPFWRA